MSKKVCCFGEMLLRLSSSNGDWVSTNNMPIHLGGAEFNTASALAQWQIPTKFVTALPDSYFMQQVLKYFDTHNIDSKDIQLMGERMGIYFLPIGDEVKNSNVVFDRSRTSFTQIQYNSFDWENILPECNWLHFSTIMHSLTENVVECNKNCVETANKLGLKISVDLNYRKSLWKDKNPQEIIPKIVENCHLIMGNIWSVEELLGIPSSIESSENKSYLDLIESANICFQRIFENYNQCETVALTFRLENEYLGVLQARNQPTVYTLLPILEIKDKVGSGDCFMTGLIYGSIQQKSDQEIIDIASAAAVNKLKEIGDTTEQTLQEIKNTINTKKIK